MNARRKWWVPLIASPLALCVLCVLLWLYNGRPQPAARLQVLSQTPTNKGQIVRFRLIPAKGGPFLANTTFQLAYDRASSPQGIFNCPSGFGLRGIYSGLRDFDVIFPNDFPVWRLQVEVQSQAPLLQRMKLDAEFTFQRLKGFGWLPTPPQFFGILDSYKSFHPGGSEVIVSEEIALSKATTQDHRANHSLESPIRADER